MIGIRYHYMLLRTYAHPLARTLKAWTYVPYAELIILMYMQFQASQAKALEVILAELKNRLLTLDGNVTDIRNEIDSMKSEIKKVLGKNLRVFPNV